MSRSITVKMPRLGESVGEGTIVRWLVTPGTKVTEFDALVEVDTDKVSTEVPVPVTGIVQALLAAEGESVKVGADIAVVEVQEPASAGGSTMDPALSDVRVGLSLDHGLSNQAPAALSGGGAQRPRHPYSPAVRELARANGIDLAEIAGSGEAGRVTRRDVIRFIEAKDVPPTAVGHAAGGPAHMVTDGDERVPLTRVRRVIAERMTQSKATIPHAWQAQEVDMSGVVANRIAHKERFQQSEGFPLTFLPYVLAAAVVGLRRHPSANATFAADHVVLHRTINIGIAIGLEDGVVAPVVRNADRLSVAGLARALGDLTTRARARRLTADDLAGGTFTVNNSGTFGTVVSYSVINPGQAGILTMGAIKDRVVAVDGRIAIRPMMLLCFSLDHRILDGLEAARFLSTCRGWLEAVTAETSIY